MVLLAAASEDSGLGGSTHDVIVFGASNTEGLEASQAAALDLGDSGDSASETEADARSTTSYEDLTCYCIEQRRLAI